VGVPVVGRASTCICPKGDDGGLTGQPASDLGKDMHLFPSPLFSSCTCSVWLVYSHFLTRASALFIFDIAHVLVSSGPVSGASH